MATPQTYPHQNPERRDFRKEVTESIIKMLEDGVAPWQKPWDSTLAGAATLPFNPTSNNAYRGGNAIHLMATAMTKGYDDPRWMTYKQAATNDWQVRKGETGTQIEFWDQKAAKDIAAEQKAHQPGTRFVHRIYSVFNAQQIEGVPAFEPKRPTPFEVVEAGEKIVANSGATLLHDQSDKAFYSRASDSIHLPKREAFEGAPGYYGTALHELAHWTGHPDRLNRQTLNESYRFGDQNYAREELRAELASVFLAAERGIPHDPGKHAAYVGSWIKALRDDKNEIFRAAQDASRATEFLLTLERDKALAEELADLPGASAPILEQETTRLESDLESEPNQSPVLTPELVTHETANTISRFEPKDGVAKVHNNATGTDYPLAVDPLSAAEKSLRSAQALTSERLGKDAQLTAAVTEGGRYRGPVIAETGELVIQQITAKSAIAHSRELLDFPPQLGEQVSISYADSHANVRGIRERTKAQELVR
jgi:antirestriction protein ArdC